jgi:phytoene dehydrogenase-like protein
MDEVDVVVVGSGPNGLVAAIELAGAGARVLVLEACDRYGGGTRTSELTLPGFRHDLCAAAHPMGALSPAFRALGLERHGLRWMAPPASFAHPLVDQPAVVHYPSIAETAAGLGADAGAYRRLVAPFSERGLALFRDALAPASLPRSPWLMLRFALRGMCSATGLAGRWFRDERARALFAGCAAHSILPLDRAMTAAMGLIFAVAGHVQAWPIAEGGSGAIARALADALAARGGRIETGRPVRSLADLPPAQLYLFDTSPATLARVAGPVLPRRYVRALERYRYGPGVFKLDWALAGPIPWLDPEVGRASTVHLGGTMAEIAAAEAAVWRGEHPERPFVMLVQQSHFDRSRAPEGKHTGYAYCHVPPGSAVDLTEVVERQIERFAPGFRELVLARHVTTARRFERYNANYVGGAITGGVADLAQLVARPALRFNPYTTPNPRVLICSASTPPGGGVHGMCGQQAALTAKRALGRFDIGPLGAGSVRSRTAIPRARAASTSQRGRVR